LIDFVDTLIYINVPIGDWLLVIGDWLLVKSFPILSESRSIRVSGPLSFPSPPSPKSANILNIGTIIRGIAYSINRQQSVSEN